MRGGVHNESMKKLFFFGFFLFFFSPFAFLVEAQDGNTGVSTVGNTGVSSTGNADVPTEENSWAVIDYPYYKKTERWIFTCKKGEKCNNLQGKRVVEEYEKSARDTFIRNLAEEIPIIGIGVSLSGLNGRSSKKITEMYQPWYTGDKDNGGYGITKKTTNHTYKYFNNPATIASGKFWTGEGEISEVAEGPRGFRRTTPTDDAPDIEILHQKGKGQVTVQSENATQALAIDEDSDAFLHLHTKVPANLKGQLKELCKELPAALVKDCISNGADTLLPGGGAIVGGVLTPVVDKLEKIIARYPTYLVPLSVKVFELIPNPSPSYAVWEIEEKPVPCGAITVAKKKLDSNCRVTLQMDKKHMVKKVTPEVKVPYYRYEIELAGSVTKQAKANTSPLIAALYSLIGRPLESDTSEDIVLDEDGFIVVPGWNIEDLPLPSEMGTPTQSQVTPPSPDLGDIGNESIFDTVSVDLKVNGQDGPIEVEKRERIVLSWISEGAIRCRGVWSKNDIKLSGTAAGRITRPVTIKIACINADGDRADDDVKVNMLQ